MFTYIPEAAFYMIGGMGDVKEKAAKLAANINNNHMCNYKRLDMYTVYVSYVHCVYTYSVLYVCYKHKFKK